MNERVMVIGKGAREHALAYRLSRNASDKIVREVLVCPGNDGIAYTQACMRPDTDDFVGLISLAKAFKPDLIVIGPEDPLSQGLADVLAAENFCVLGPSQRAAQIETSKSFMKELAAASKIPTASFNCFDNAEQALNFARGTRYPLVIKADGLCAGKGVVITHTFEEAKESIESLILKGRIVIEEYLEGAEMSVIALCNEDDAQLFAPVRDHKKLLDQDKGPNTGGMGAVGPLPQAIIPGFMSGLKENFFLPTLRSMQKKGCPFRGALFAGLMVNGSDIRLLEFNARFGDPETQTLMFGCQIDLFPIFMDVAKGNSLRHYSEDYLLDMMPTSTITMAARGYPQNPIQGDLINITEIMPEQCMVLFAGVARNRSGQLITEGGRILSCTARAESLRMAIHKSYDIVSRVSFFGAQYRADIGQSLL